MRRKLYPILLRRTVFVAAGGEFRHCTETGGFGAPRQWAARQLGVLCTPWLAGLEGASSGPGSPDSAIMRQGRWSSSALVAKYTRGESAGDAARWL